MSLTPIQNFYRQTIAQDWPVGTGNMYVSVKPTVSTGYLTISPASSTLREIVYFTATGTDGTGDFVTISTGGRGKGGTTEQTHIIGEPIRMNVTAETIDEISDQLDSIVAAGAPDATTSIKGIAKLPRIYTTTSTTYSLTTLSGERVVVWAKGTSHPTGEGGTDYTVLLKYNGTQKDSINAKGGTAVNVNTFLLMYTEVPGAGTANVTITTTETLNSDTLMIIQII